jgi:hypothetical protein
MSHLAHTRPRSAAEIIDAAFRLYRAHWGELVMVSALLLVPPALLTVVTPPWFHSVIQLSENVMFLVVQGAMAVLVSAAIEEDRAISAGETLRRLGARAGSVLGASILSLIIIMIGALFLIVPGVVLAVWTSVATPVAAIERVRSSRAIERSRELTRGHFWRTLGTVLFAWIIMFVLAFGGSLAIEMIGVPEAISDGLLALLFVALFPFVGIAVTLLYYDLRVRNEGADLVAMIEALEPGSRS